MLDEFVNRLGMFSTALGVLNSPQHKPTWQNQPPAIFTAKVQDAKTEHEALVAFTTSHSQVITGAAVDTAAAKRVRTGRMVK